MTPDRFEEAMALKIPDYFASVNPQEGRRISGRHGTAADPGGAFIHLLSRSGDGEPVTSSAGTGLTITDYLARPVACPVVRPMAPAADPAPAAPSVAPEEPAVDGSIPPRRDPPWDPGSGKGDEPHAVAARMDRAQTAVTEAAVDDPREIIDRSVARASRMYRLPRGLLRAVIRAESNFDPRAVSPAGAQGLMQLMPATAKELGVVDPFDIEQNVDGGARYLRQMLDRFNGNLKSALAAYNAGPGTVARFRGKVPYVETVRYVARVMADARRAV